MPQPEYECVMLPKTPIILRSRKWTLRYRDYLVEGFSTDADGKHVPNGIRLMVRKFLK